MPDRIVYQGYGWDGPGAHYGFPIACYSTNEAITTTARWQGTVTKSDSSNGELIVDIDLAITGTGGPDPAQCEKAESTIAIKLHGVISEHPRSQSEYTTSGEGTLLLGGERADVRVEGLHVNSGSCTQVLAGRTTITSNGRAAVVDFDGAPEGCVYEAQSDQLEPRTFPWSLDGEERGAFPLGDFGADMMILPTSAMFL